MVVKKQRPKIQKYRLLILKGSKRWSSDTVLEIFSKFGIIINLSYQKHSGVGWVDFSDLHEAENAYFEINGSTIRRCYVVLSRSWIDG